MWRSNCTTVLFANETDTEPQIAVTNFPAALYDVGAAGAGGFIYFAGGWDGAGYIRSLVDQLPAVFYIDSLLSL